MTWPRVSVKFGIIARPIDAAASRGNVVLFCDGGNHARTRRLPGGGGSLAKPVSTCYRGKNRVKFGFRLFSPPRSVLEFGVVAKVSGFSTRRPNR
jgi:hypothetical protein